MATRKIEPKKVDPRQAYYDAQAKLLVGRKIDAVQFVDGFPILVLDNGVCAVIQQDDEGNGPGALSFQTIDGKSISVFSPRA